MVIQRKFFKNGELIRFNKWESGFVNTRFSGIDFIKMPRNAYEGTTPLIAATR